MGKEESKDMYREEIRARVEILMDLVLGLVRTIIKALEMEQVLDLVRVAIRDLGVEQVLDLARMAIRDLEVEQVLDLARAFFRVETVGLECTACLPQENCLEVAILRVQEDLLGGS